MNRAGAIAGIILLLWLGTFLRFYRLDAQSFWNDEGNSARLSERSPALIIEGTASDIHPPLYYLLLRGWRELLGDSEFGLRSFSAFAGVLAVAATYALARCLLQKGNGPPLLAALFAAVNPALVYYGQETRMYSLLGLLAVLSTLLLVKWLPRLGRLHQSRGVAVGYLLLAVAGLYTHYFFPAVLLFHNLLVLLWLVLLSRHHLLPRLLHWGGVLAAAFLLYLPWLPVFLRQAGGKSGESAAPSLFLTDAARWLVAGETAAGPAWALVAFAGLLMLGFLLWLFTRLPVMNREEVDQLLLWWPWLVGGLGVMVPLVLMLFAGTTRPAYFKFMIVAVPFLALLLGQAGQAVQVSNRPVRGGLTAVLFALLAVALWNNGRSLQNMYFNPAAARADYRGMAARIAREGHSDAGIILNAANQWEVFTYYHREGAPVYPVPRGQPQAESIARELETIAGRHDRLYAIFWGEAERDPERLVERWLDSHAYKATEEWVGDVRFVTYALPQAAASQMETRLGLRFGEHITLLGYTLGQGEVQPGDIIPLTLFWKTDAALDSRYKLFLHLVDETGTLVTQRDSEPGGGLALTTTWVPGEQVVDNHGLLVPAETPPGRYTIRLGLYELTDPAARLPILAAEGPVDAYSLGPIVIE